MPAKTKTRRKKNNQQKKNRQTKSKRAITDKVVSKTKTPFEMLHLRKQKCFSVRRKDKKNPKVFSKCTTKEKAERQMKLLHAIIYNKTFKKRGT
jgi:hypothetical protein